MLSRNGSSQNGEGMGGWISNMVQRARGGGNSEGDSSSAQYKRVEQDEDER